MLDTVLDKIVRFNSAGSINFDDLKTIIEYCTDKGLVIELGTNIGTTTECLSLAAKKVISIDVFENIDLIENQNSRKVYAESIRVNQHTFDTIRKKLYPCTNVTLHCGLSYSFTNFYSDDSVDVLFVDADHSVEGVTKDFEAWTSKVKQKGFILFHDYHPNYGVFEFLANGLKGYSKIVNKNTKSSIAIFQKD